MCFSPSVSFAASAALAVGGMLTLRKASFRNEFLFAAVPLFFACQQLIEGLIWLELLKGEAGNAQSLTQDYAIFVGLIWPILIPFSLWMMEAQHACRKYMLMVVAAGAGLALYTTLQIWHLPVSARISEYCIVYEYPYPQPHYLLAVYVIATCAAFFFASDAAIRWLGMGYLGSFAITYYFYRYNLTSVWCFFAAIISGFIYLHFSRRQVQAIRTHPACGTFKKGAA